MRSIRWTSVLLTLAALLACNSGQKPNVSVSLKTTATPQASTGGADLGNGITLTEVRMVVRRITLFPGPQTQDAPPAAGEMDADHPEADDRDDFPHSSFGPFAVDSVFTSTSSRGIQAVFDASVDQGAYSCARIAINTLGKTQATDPVLSAMRDLHASIAIDGTIDGAKFEFKTPMRVAQWKQGPIVVGEGTTNLTLDVDPTGWFTGPNGTRLDPTSRRDRGEILENIRCSIRLFKDDDRDGKPDDGDDDTPEGCGGHRGGD